MKKTTLILAAALLGPVVWADEEPPPPPPENQKIESQERASQERPSQRRQRQMRDFFASLSEKERKELRTLQESNPEEARKVMAQQLEKYNQKIRERENFLRTQIQIYQTSDSKEVRDKAYAEIKKMIVEDFERNMKEHRRMLDFLERERYESRRKNSSAIIQARIDELTKPPELRW